MKEPERLELRSVALLCVAACWLLGCAEGYEGVDAIRQSAASGQLSGGGGMVAPGAGAGAGGAGAGMGGSAAGAAGGTGTSSGATGAGMPCLRGETEVCTCVDKGTMGQMTCVFDAASPLDGFFSDCSRCPEPMTTDPGDVTSNDAGTPMGGSGGSGRAGSGGSGSAGSGGSAPPPPPPPPPPTTGGSRTCASPCNQPCFPIGILACCNPLGICGCTWAPGGYCL